MPNLRTPLPLSLLIGYDIVAAICSVGVGLMSSRLAGHGFLRTVGAISPGLVFLSAALLLYQRERGTRVAVIILGWVLVVMGVVLAGALPFGRELLEPAGSDSPLSLLGIVAPRLWWMVWWVLVLFLTGALHVWALTRPEVRQLFRAAEDEQVNHH